MSKEYTDTIRLALVHLGVDGAGPLYAYEMARALAADRRVDLLCIVSRHSENISLWRTLALQGVRLMEVDSFTSRRDFIRKSITLRPFFAIARALRRHRAQCLYSPMIDLWQPLIFKWFTPRGCLRIKTIHDLAPHPGEDGFLMKLYHRFTLKNTERVVTLSRAFVPELCRRGFTASDIIVVPHANFSRYTTHFSPGLRQGLRRKLLFFGRILAYKGLDVLLDAWRIVVRERPDLRLVIAGAGDTSPYAAALAELHEHIELHIGKIPDTEVGGYFEECDLVVLPYREASQSGIIPVAFSFGKPVIATDLGGIPEQLASGGGVLIEPGNPTTLAGQILQLYADPDRLQRLGQEATTTAYSKMSWEASAEQLLAGISAHNIIYLITGLGLGGAEIVTIALANLMVQRGHSVQIVYMSGDNQHIGRIDPRIVCHGLGMSKSPLGLLRALCRCRRIVRGVGCRPIVHAQMFHANILARLLRLITRKIRLLICSEHNYEIGGGWLRMWLYRLTDPLSDINTNVSDEATARFMKEHAFSARKSTTMYNGIDRKKFTPELERSGAIRALYHIRDNEILLLNAGRLTQAKNQACLIRAFAAAHARDPRLRLIIIGKGELRAQLQQQIDRLGVTNKAILAGAHPNVVDYYGAADLFVMSSLWEGLPMTILEAMASGKPVITTDVGGATETIRDPSWIVPAGDCELLVEAILRMASLTPAERAKIGETNRTKSLDFDLRTIGNRWEALYRSGRVEIPTDHRLLVE